MVVKIGVIFMPFSNPTCLFRHTGDFIYPPKGFVKFFVGILVQMMTPKRYFETN